MPNDIVEQGNGTIMKEATEENRKSEGKEEVLSALQLKSWDTGVVDTGSGDTGGGDVNVVGDVKEVKKVENYEWDEGEKPTAASIDGDEKKSTSYEDWWSR